MNIKPIPTTYRGITFRSKLEAHWAVYFDQCGVKWEYEPQGFDLGDGIWYLPDFLLHDVRYWDEDGSIKPKDLWIEVKGVMDFDSIKKIEHFAYGDRETQIKNLRKAADKKLEDQRYDFVLGLPWIYCPVQNPILVVGQMPLENDFWTTDDVFNSPHICLSAWVHDTFQEAKLRRLFYSYRTINNDDVVAFPIINEDGKFEIQEGQLINKEEYEKTIKALNYARNYRFDHRKK